MRLRLSLVVTLALFTFSCSGGGGSSTGETDLTGPQPDTASPDVVDPGGEDVVPIEDVAVGSRAIFFTVGSSIEATRGGPTAIPVQVVDLAASEPAVGAEVTLTLEGEGDGSLDSETLTTGEGGTAEASFDAGDVVPATYTLTATAAGVEEDAVLTISVVPRDEGTGHIRVTFQYVDTVPLSNIDVYPYADMGCDDIDPLSPPTTVGTASTDDIESSALLADLDSDSVWTVLARAEDESGRLVATGCLEGVHIAPDIEIPVLVDLAMLPVDIAGDYGLSVELDLGDVAVDIATPEVDAFRDMLDDGGVCMSRGIAGVIRTLRPEVFEALSPEDEAALVNELADAALVYTELGFPQGPNDSIVDNGFSATLRTTFESVVLEGSLTVETPVGAIDSDGETTWESVALTVNDSPVLLPVDDLLELPHPFELASSSWSANVHSFDRITVNIHTLTLDVALLVRHFMDVLWFEALVGQGGDVPESFLALTAGVYDCSALATSFVGDDTLGDYGITAAEFEAGCEDALYACYTQDIERAVNDTLTGSDLRIYGAGVLQVSEQDLSVDRIDGSYSGSLEREGLPGSPVTGIFAAERQASR